MQRQKSTAICCAFFSISFMLLLLTGCTKTGSNGANGKDGTIILNGEGVPTNAVGSNGNYYLDLASAILYGPKSSSGWGIGISLKGAPGTPGSQIYSGSGTPSGSLGVTGDYYLDKTNFLLYGPKTTSVWGMPINLQGPQGNSNVMVDTFTLVNSDWVWNSTYDFSAPNVGGGVYTRYHDCAFSKVTQKILDEGEVMVYFTPNNSNLNQWAPLPYSFSFNDKYSYNFVFETMPGVVRLHFFYSAIGLAGYPLPDLDTDLIGTYKFKIVAVSGTISTNMKRDHVHTDNYQEVSRYLSLSF